VDHAAAKLGISERLALRVLGQHCSTQRKKPSRPDDEAALTADITALAIHLNIITTSGLTTLSKTIRMTGGNIE